jgi:hypothetical protein
MPYSDVVSIAATTSGVTGTITTQYGAHLRKINLAWTQAATGDLPQIIELTWTGSPTPLRFVPNAISMVAGTPVGGNANLMGDSDGLEIPLDVTMEKADVLTIKVTSSGNLTVKISVEWD